jgi:hypothetical protein
MEDTVLEEIPVCKNIVHHGIYDSSLLVEGYNNNSNNNTSTTITAITTTIPSH